MSSAFAFRPHDGPSRLGRATAPPGASRLDGLAPMAAQPPAAPANKGTSGAAGAEPAAAPESPRRLGPDDAFAFAALHDLKEPLHLVKGYLQLLRRADLSGLDDAGREYVENAYDGAERMQAILVDLLDYFRADSKGLDPRRMSLDDALDEALAGLRLQAQESGAILTREPLPDVVADKAQVARVLQNLLSNAFKFHGEAAPHVHVAAHRRGDWCELVVQDDGIGIPAKDLERVLKPFQRVHSADRYPGTGLGLSISKKVVEAHGGRLWLESTPGHGTGVHLTLPLPRAAEA